MKLYIVKGIKVKSEKSKSTYKKINSFIGYYSNLKEVYSQFERKTVRSYSSIANKINESNHYIAYDSKFSIDDKMIKFQKIKIERVEVNKVYHKSGSITFSHLIAQELSDFNF